MTTLRDFQSKDFPLKPTRLLFAQASPLLCSELTTLDNWPPRTLVAPLLFDSHQRTLPPSDLRLAELA